MTEIETFIRVLRKAGLTLDDIELAESLWLAQYLPVPTVEVGTVGQPASGTRKAAALAKPSSRPVRSSRQQPTLDTPVAASAGERALYPEVAPTEVRVASRAKGCTAPRL